MNKIFTNTNFIGKKHINLPSCHSTNDIAAAMSVEKWVPEGTLISTDDQTKGRGQRGNAWLVAPKKNITCSVILKPSFLSLSYTFYLNIITSLAVKNTLQQLIRGKNVQIKWPNDIYCEGKKICGILIENTLQNQKLGNTIVGMGLNVNQTQFTLPNATSMALLSGDTFDRQVVMEIIMVQLEQRYAQLKALKLSELRDAYLENMYWKDEIHVFSVGDHKMNGIIRGIEENGRLQVEHENDWRSYDFKEIVYLR